MEYLRKAEGSVMMFEYAHLFVQMTLRGETSLSVRFAAR